MRTRMKLILINVIIAAGSIAIFLVQWPEAMKPRGYGGGYDQGPAASVFLALLLTAIPIVLYAVAVHVALSHWLFGPGELKTHRAQQLVNSIPAQKSAERQTEQTASGVEDDIHGSGERISPSDIADRFKSHW
jgi:hypothetical protein